MKSINQKVNELMDSLLYKKRIKDEDLVFVQEKVNKIKEIIDDEIKRRAENLNKQVVK